MLCRRGACLLRLSGAASNQGTNWAGVLLEGALVDDATHTALAGILATQKNPQYKSQMKGVACISLEGKRAPRLRRAPWIDPDLLPSSC